MKKVVVGLALLFVTAGIAEAASGQKRKRRVKRKQKAAQSIEADAVQNEQSVRRRKVQDIPESSGTSAVAPMTQTAPGLMPFGISFELMTGRRWYEPKFDGEVNGIRSTVVSTAAHAMYRPGMFAIGVGPKINLVAFEFDDYDDETDTDGALAEFALETVGKIDLGLFKPFLKAEYTAIGSGVIEVTGEGSFDDYESETDIETSGAVFGLGTEIMILTNLKAIIEAQYGVQMVRTTKTTTTTENEFGIRETDTDSEDSSRGDFNSKSLLIGLGGSF